MLELSSTNPFWQNYCAKEFNGISTRLLFYPPFQQLIIPWKKLTVFFYHFLWNGKGDKMKRDIMINDHANGGLNMPFLATLKRLI